MIGPSNDRRFVMLAKIMPGGSVWRMDSLEFRCEPASATESAVVVMSMAETGANPVGFLRSQANIACGKEALIGFCDNQQIRRFVMTKRYDSGFSTQPKRTEPLILLGKTR